MTQDGVFLCAFVCLCVHAYMKPQQSLLLHRRGVARESAADEAKHFLHREGKWAQLNIKHLAVNRITAVPYKFIHIAIL